MLSATRLQFSSLSPLAVVTATARCNSTLASVVCSLQVLLHQIQLLRAQVAEAQLADGGLQRKVALDHNARGVRPQNVRLLRAPRQRRRGWFGRR